MAVTYRTMKDYPRGRWIRGDFYGITKLKCAWSDAGTLLGEIDQSPAWPYTDIGPSTAVAYDAEVKPFAVQTNSATPLSSYNYALVVVKYTTRGPTWVADHGSITESYGAAAVSLPVAEDSLFWSVGGVGVPLNPNEIEHPVFYVQEYRIKWEQVVSPAPSYWANLIGATLNGCTNSNTVTAFTSSRTFAAGTLRFVPPTITTTYGIGVTARQTVTLGLHYKPTGWNKFWHTVNGWSTVYKNAACTTPYAPYTPAVFPSRT